MAGSLHANDDRQNGPSARVKAQRNIRLCRGVRLAICPRLHLELHVADAAEQAAGAARLVSLDARRVDWDSYREDPDVVVLADTVGKLF